MATVYTPPPADQAGISLGSGYYPPAGDNAGMVLEQVYDIEVVTSCTVPLPHRVDIDNSCAICTVITANEIQNDVAINCPVVDWLEADVSVYRPPALESVSVIERASAALINNSVLVVRRPATSVDTACTVVRGSFAVAENACAVLLGVASALLEAGCMIEREHLTRTPVERGCDIITIDASAASLEQANIAFEATVSGAVTSGGVPADAYSAEDIISGRVVDLGESPLNPTALSLSIDRASYAITGSLTLINTEEYTACIVGRAVVVRIGADSVSLFVADRKRTRTHGQWTYTIDLASMSTWCDKPFSTSIDASSFSGHASTIAASLLHPVTTSWECVDWPLSQTAMAGIGKTTGIEAVRAIKDAAGGVIQSLADGSVVIEPEYLRMPDEWQGANADYIVDESAEVVSVDDDDDWRDGANQYRVGNVAEGLQDGSISISLEDDQTGGKVVRVATVPWSGSVSATHAGGPSVQLALIGDRYRDETEVVQIIDGEGSLQYPYHGGLVVDFLERDIGAITAYEDGSLLAPSGGDTLAKISYITRSRDYSIVNPSGDDVLVVASTDFSESSNVSATTTVGAGDKPGDEFVSQLITRADVAMAKGKQLSALTCSRRLLVTAAMPYRGVWRTGRLVSLLDAAGGEIKGILRSQQISAQCADDGSVNIDSTITIETQQRAALVD